MNFLELYKKNGTDIKASLEKLQQNILWDAKTKKEFSQVNKGILKRIDLIDEIRCRLDDCICEAYPDESDTVILHIYY